MESLEAGLFTKVNEALDPEHLQPSELSELVNMVLDGDAKGLRAIKRGGFVFNNESSLAAAPVSLFDAVDQDGNNYVLAVQTTKLQKSLNGTGVWSDVKTGLTSAQRSRIAPVGGGKYIVSNGSDPLYVISGSNFSSALNLEIARPDVQGVTVAVSNTDGGIVAQQAPNRRRYILAYYTETGELSNVSLPIAAMYDTQDFGTFSAATTTGKITLSNIPASTDTRVKSIRVYRTTENGAIYYLNAVLPNITQSYVDKTPDSNLDTSESIQYLNVPVKSKYITYFKDRIFLANITRQLKNNSIPPARTGLQVAENPGSIDLGTYRWAYSYVDEDGSESELSPYVQHEIVAETAKATLTGFSMPRVGARTMEKSVIRFALYRTHKNETSPFYLSTTIDTYPTMELQLASIEDDNTDDLLTHVYPSFGTGATTTKNLKSYIAFSEILKYSNIKETSLLPVFPDDGDEITGIFDDGNSLLVWKKNSICRVYCSGSPENWRVEKVAEGIGCDDPESIVKTVNGYYFSKFKQIYLFSDGIKPISQDFEKSWKQVTQINGVCYSNKKNWLIYSVSVGASYYLYVYDEKIGSWYKFTITQAGSLLEKQFGQSSGTILIGNTSYLDKYSDTATQDNEFNVSNADISCSLKTKTFTFPEGIALARLRELFVNYKKSGNVTFTISNPDTNVNNAHLDTDGAGNKTYRVVTGKSTDNLKETNKISLQASGVGLVELSSMRLQYRSINRGKRG